jgi:uncharacterized membrane-anchored protein
MIKQFLALLCLWPLMVAAQNQPVDIGAEIDKLNWQRGPTTGAIGTLATIAVPEGFAFLGEKDAKRFIELLGNPPPSEASYILASKEGNWFAVFQFDQSGYVKDDEKIDAAELLKKIKESDGPSNEERKRLGLSALYTDGWAVEPHYDSQTKRLEWGLRLRDDKGQMAVNYTSRILGRTGVMRAILVTDLNSLDRDVASYKTALQDYKYIPGQSYAEFKPGDKVAEYGLAALILGGAAAVATKKGFWTILAGFFAAAWKFIVAAVIASTAWIKKLFKKKGQ